MICCLTALSRATRKSPVSSGPRAVPAGAGLATRADVCVRTRLQDREQLARSPHVVAHLLDQRLDAVEADHAAQPVEELDGDVLAVEVQIGVEHVGLDPPLGA